MMARCEIRGLKAVSAARRLLPFLLLKKGQALLLLEVARLRPRAGAGFHPSEAEYTTIETMRKALSALQTGFLPLGAPLPVDSYLSGYHRLSPEPLGWSREQLFAYLAGIIDSDGNLRVGKHRAVRMHGSHYRINIRCAQVSPSPAVELLAKTFGGKVGHLRSVTPNHRELDSWSLYDRAAVPAIEALLPHLVVKRAEALLLLDLLRLKAEGKKGVTEWEHANRWRDSVRMPKRCYTAEQVAEFERVLRAVQLIHSGTSPPT